MSEIEELRKDIEIYQERIKTLEILNRLENNPDFKFIKNKFCVENCARLVAASVDPSLDPRIAKHCARQAQAAGYFNLFLEELSVVGNAAKSRLKESEDTLVELMNKEE